MKTLTDFARLSALAASLLALSCSLARAQAPFSGVVLKEKELQLRLDMQAYAAPRARGGWTWGLPSLTAGLGKGAEVSVGMSATDPRSTNDMTIAMKWSPRFRRNSPVQVAVGFFSFLPLNSAPELGRVRPMTFSYIAATAPILPKLGEASPILTLAVYGVDTPRPGPFSDRAGGMIGLAQGLPPSFARVFGADAAQAQFSWVTGKTMFGYSSSGITFLKGRTNISLGYTHGNFSQSNYGPSLGVGFAL